VAAFWAEPIAERYLRTFTAVAASLAG
jgi:hypothetical protein